MNELVDLSGFTDDIAGDLVKVSNSDAWPDGRNSTFFSFKHDIVNQSLLIGKSPIDRNGASDIGSVVLPLCSNVHHKKFAGGQRTIAFLIVKNGGLFARSNDRIKRHVLCTLPLKRVFQNPAKLVFGDSGADLGQKFRSTQVGDMDRP